MLSQRQADLLSIIVHEYIESALPVGSETVVQKYPVGVSPATVRNEMVHLEEQGYLTHPHTSAGRIPSDRGYRYFVESLMHEPALPEGERRLILHQFHQVARQIDEWIELAAAVTSQALGNAAVVTAPRASEARLRQVQLISIQDHVALLVAVLEGGRVKQEMLGLPEPMDQESLVTATNQLNADLAGKTATEVRSQPNASDGLEARVVEEVLALLAQEDRAGSDAVLHGVRDVLRQPEFARSSRLLHSLDLLDQNVLKRVIPFELAEVGHVVALIGEENADEAMHDWSVVLTRYGERDALGGALAVLGPTRMEYGRAISTIRFVAAVMSDLIAGYFGPHASE